MKVTEIPILMDTLGTVTKGLMKELKDLEMRTGGDCQNYSIVEIGQNIDKSPEYLRKLAVTQTPEDDHQLTLVWKTPKWVVTKMKSSFT